MACDKCEAKLSVKPWSVKALGLCGIFTWHFCEVCMPKAEFKGRLTAQEISGLIQGGEHG